MPPAIRQIFPYLALVLLGVGVAWAMSFGTLPPADFTFANGDEVKTLDPGIATGSPEHRILDALFEGLLRLHPVEVPGGAEKNLYENVPLKLLPGVADLPEVTNDGQTYTFHFLPDRKWSNGRAVTAPDFVFSWQRLLHPENAGEYAYQLHYVVGGKKYNLEQLEIGDPVEVELYDRPVPSQMYPRGTMIRGKLTGIWKPEKPTFAKDTPAAEQESQLAQWKKSFVYTVQAETKDVGERKYAPLTGTFRYSKDPSAAVAGGFDDGQIVQCHHVLADFDKVVGIRALDDNTLQVELNSATPYFDQLTAFFSLYPVCRECVEKYGTPEWTRTGHLIGNGAYTLKKHRVRDRIRLEKSATYWNREHVPLEVVDALALKSDTTALNMYLTGQVDWIITVPNTVVQQLREDRTDFYTTPMLTTYFYRVNVNKPPLNDVRIRRALNAAINKALICDEVLKAGQIPARSYVPPGIAGYHSELTGDQDLEEARKLLAEAGYPNGKGMPKVEILFNTNEDHRVIAEVIQQQWRKLGINCELRNLEWGSFLDALSNQKYMVSRSAWTGDYADPNTFLDMFVTDGPNNQTGWSNAEYDRLIEAAKHVSAEERLKLLSQAERILMDELPILPIYFYVTKNMVNPRVKGFRSNIQDLHPLDLLSVEPPNAPTESTTAR
jgi:oligopeptide transport system substrate-binding protein